LGFIGAALGGFVCKGVTELAYEAFPSLEFAKALKATPIAGVSKILEKFAHEQDIERRADAKQVRSANYV
jgi:hypothetical protein